MEENDISSHVENKNKKRLTKKGIIFIVIILFFISYIISLYSLEKEKWVNNNPYPKAKEYLVPANMLMLGTVVLSKVPFIDERSLIMKPLISMQDYYIEKWQENLPDDDAEKYLGWYFFRLNTLIVPNVRSTILYTDEIYSFEEVREMLDKIWFTLEKLHKHKAKDLEFEEMRYTAFLKLSYLYVDNAMAYWYNEREKAVNTYILDNDKKVERFIELYDWLQEIDAYYKNNYPEVYEKNRSTFYDEKRIHQLMVWVLDYYNYANRYKQINGYCDNSKNIYLQEYLTSRSNLLDLKAKESAMGQNAIDKTLSDFTDKRLNAVCNNLNLKKGIKHAR